MNITNWPTRRCAADKCRQGRIPCQRPECEVPMNRDDWADWGNASIVAAMLIVGVAALVWVIASAHAGKLVWPW